MIIGGYQGTAILHWHSVSFGRIYSVDDGGKLGGKKSFAESFVKIGMGCNMAS